MALGAQSEEMSGARNGLPGGSEYFARWLKLPASDFAVRGLPPLHCIGTGRPRLGALVLLIMDDGFACIEVELAPWLRLAWQDITLLD